MRQFIARVGLCLLCLLLASAAGCQNTGLLRGIWPEDYIAAHALGDGRPGVRLYRDGTFARPDGEVGMIDRIGATRLWGLADELIVAAPDGHYRSPFAGAASLEIARGGVRHVYVLVRSAEREVPGALYRLLLDVRRLEPGRAEAAAQALASNRMRLKIILDDLRFESIALGEALSMLAKAANVEMYVAWGHLHDAGVGRTTRVPLAAREQTAEAVLRAVLAAAGKQAFDKLDVDVNEEGLFVATHEVVSAHDRPKALMAAPRPDGLAFRAVFDDGDFCVRVLADGTLDVQGCRATRKLAPSKARELWRDARGLLSRRARPGHYRLAGPGREGYDATLEVQADGETYVYVLAREADLPRPPLGLLDLADALAALAGREEDRPAATTRPAK